MNEDLATQPVLRPTRRILFSGLGALGVAAALAGCAGNSAGEEESTPEVERGTELVATDEVPVGGGVILTDEKVVITQPTAGTFKAFTAVCTHQGLTVTGVADDQIQCDNHGSRFSMTDGSVEVGPAPAPLAEIAIKVEGNRILAA
ncbi:MAG: Rieske (2Fe-2S) protein [Nocardioidaceae bacterium]|nr:Rieske (2Fe-2S) protein [Nocardioidaceae bacterium]